MLYVVVAAASAFNLVCAGTTTYTEYSGSKSEPYRIVYRLDTAKKLWCKDNEEACKSPQKIAELTPVSIKFADKTVDKPDQYFRYVEQVNRETGLHQTLTIGGRNAFMHIEKQEGHCEVAPFSGFSKTNPKF